MIWMVEREIRRALFFGDSITEQWSGSYGSYMLETFRRLRPNVEVTVDRHFGWGTGALLRRMRDIRSSGGGWRTATTFLSKPAQTASVSRGERTRG